MNLTGRPVTPKGSTRTSPAKARPANKEEKAHWVLVRALGCIVGPLGCDYNGRDTTLHHCGTGGGGRKDHMKVIPLCHEHHQGKEGIDGKRMSKRAWQEKYGTEKALLDQVHYRLTGEVNF